MVGEILQILLIILEYTFLFSSDERKTAEEFTGHFLNSKSSCSLHSKVTSETAKCTLLFIDLLVHQKE